MADQKHSQSAIYAGLDKTEEMKPTEGIAMPSVEEAVSNESKQEAPATASEARQGSGGGKGAKIAIAVIVVISLVLIAVSAFALAGGFSSGESAKEVNSSATVQAENPDAENAGAQPADNADASDPDKQNGEGDNPEEGSSSANDSASDDAVTKGSGDSDKTSGSTTNGSAGATTPSKPSGGEKPSEKPSAFTVHVSVGSSVSGVSVSYSCDVKVNQGDTVYDALEKSNIPHNARGSQFGIYVDSIGGVAESADYGWTYYLNGQFINASCSSVELQAGDSIRWVYVLVE